jgi:ABC-type nitrate/sulfonate/bicarbonate transport system ATPase subunit
MRAYLLAQNLLILDEPFGSSDTDVKTNMYDLCTAWLNAEKSRLLVFTSHDADDAEALGAKTLHLEPLQGGERSTWRLE